LQARGEPALEADGGAKAGDDRILPATKIRSCARMSLETAAAISGVRPGASAASVPAVARSESSQSRNSPTVRPATGAKAALASAVEAESKIRRVTSSVS
jgi:hypothetical protein